MEVAERAWNRLARAALVLSGVVVQLASVAGVIAFAIWLLFGKSWAWGVAGVTLSAAAFGLGLKCVSLGLRSAAAPNRLGRPVDLWMVVLHFAQFLVLLALTAPCPRSATRSHA